MLLAEVSERDTVGKIVPDECPGHLRDEHLPPVAGAADTRCAVHSQAEIVLARELDLAGVYAHAHEECAIGRPLARVQASLGVDGGGDAVGRGAEGHEVGLALPVDHLSTGLCDRGFEQLMVDGQHLAVRPSAEFFEQARRAFDVGEEEGDGPGLGVNRHYASHLQDLVAFRKCQHM